MARPTAVMQQWIKAAAKEVKPAVPETEKRVEKLCAGCGGTLTRMPWNEKCIYWVCDKESCTQFRRPQVREMRKGIVPEVEGLARRR